MEKVGLELSLERCVRLPTALPQNNYRDLKIAAFTIGFSIAELKSASQPSVCELGDSGKASVSRIGDRVVGGIAKG